MLGIKKIKRIGLWLLLGLSLSWLLSCNSAPSTSGKAELEFWTMQLQPKFSQYFNAVIANFEKENPDIKIRWVDVPWEAMESKILTAVSANTAPDVVNLNPNFASQLAARNAWLNLNEKVTIEAKKEYLPKIWQASTLGDRSFGIPWYLTTQIAIFNQDLLAKAGISSPPATYQELAKVAQQIKEKTGKYACFFTFVPDDSGEVLESLVQMGVKLVDGDGKAAFDNPTGLAAFRYWVDLYKKGLLPPEVLTQGHRHGIELYQAGELAMLSAGAEFVETIATNAPAVAKVSTAAPQITGDTGKKNVAVMNLIIPNSTDKPEQAVKFALVVANTANQLAFAKSANVLPSTVDGVAQYIKDIDRQENISSLQKDASKVSAMQLKDAEVLVPAMKNLNQLQKLIYENLQAAMLDEKTVEQAVKDAAQQWNQLND